ncbi:MAG TPA: hypothetical protein VFX96_00870 [Pyrinomonadaceae bacterium]|nr:hypothetical protein [Pyrinomonadaceae bacterium]
MLKRTVFICSLLLASLAFGAAAFGQRPAPTEAPKPCPFNIVGTWRMESSAADPMLFRFASDGTVTLLSRIENPDEDFEVQAAVKYKLDKPSAPKSIDFIAARGNEVFGRGTTTYTITEFSDDSFTTVNPMTHAGLVRWVRAKTNRYFLTFAARSMPIDAYYDDNSVAIHPTEGRPTRQTMGGPAFAMWTKLGGRKTEVETLGLHMMTDGTRTIPVVGPVPDELQKQFASESRKESDVMIRLELTEAEYERTHKVFRTWDKRVRDKTLLYDDPYLNAMEFLRRTAESLNLCGEKVKLHKLNWSQWDAVATKHHLPEHPLEYIRIMRKRNDELHVTDESFPAGWRPSR